MGKRPPSGDDVIRVPQVDRGRRGGHKQDKPGGRKAGLKSKQRISKQMRKLKMQRWTEIRGQDPKTNGGIPKQA